MKLYGYRCNSLFGEGHIEAAEVMAHETFELMNTDIPHTLASTLFKNHPIGEKLEILEEEINNQCIADGDNGLLYSIIENYSSDDTYKKLGIKFFQEVVDAINVLTNKKIKYCLWLCDTMNDVLRYDHNNEISYADIESYLLSDIILSDIGDDGKLYAYESIPESISKETPKLTTNIKPLKDNSGSIVDYAVHCCDCDMFICYPTEHDAHNTYKYCPRCGNRNIWQDNYDN